MRAPLLALIFAGVVLQAGCVTGRRTLELPVTDSALAAAVQGHVYIASITDDRQFENKPSDPSTPSVDGDVTKLSPQQKGTMIGRQRNGYGHAMGDIGLASGDSVVIRTRLLVEQSLRQQGYQIASDPSAPNTMTVSIQKFWAWMTPGFVSLSFEAQLQCHVSVTNRSGTKSAIIKGYALNHGQFAKNENWLEAYEPAFQDFVTNFDNAAPGLGLLTDAEFQTQKAKLLAP